jgi:hypothetical protein
MRDFDLIPFDEGTEVMGAPAIVAALQPRKSKSKSKRRSRREPARREAVAVQPPAERVATVNAAPLEKSLSQKSNVGFWLLIALASALLIAQVI